MKRKILAMVMVISMVLSLAVMPTYAAKFSSDNKRKNYYDICLNTDSNFIQLKGNGYEKNCLQFDSLSIDYNHTNTTDGMAAGESGNFYTKNRAKFKGETTSSKHLLYYRWAGGIMGRDSSGNTVSADIPVFVHQRLHIAWYAERGMTKFDFLPYRDASWNANTSAGFTFYKADGGYINTYAPKSEWSMLKYNESPFTMTTSANSPVFNTIDVIYDFSNGHSFAMFMFIEGKLVGISRPSSNRPDKFYGWAIRSNDAVNRQNDYIEIWGDEATGWGHTEYIQANGYYPTLEDVLQDQGLMTDSVSDSTIMMKTSAIKSYMPPASANCKVNDTQINTDVTYSGGVATITHEQSDTSTDEIAAHMLQGVIPPNNSGVSYASYHPRAKYVKLSFDQKINSGTVAYKVCYNTNRTDSIQFWKDSGYLYGSVRGGGGNNYLNGANGRATAEEDATNHIDWVLEFHENEEETGEGGIIQYLYCNGKFVGQGKIGVHSNNRLADITVETKGSANPEVEISNWSMTLYNEDAAIEDIGEEITGGSGSVEEPLEPENIKVLFGEDFEGETAGTLSTTYPYNSGIGEGSHILYQGDWAEALTTGFEDGAGIFACGGVTDKSVILKSYFPEDKRPMTGLANIKFNIKPQASLSTQDLQVYREAARNPIKLFGNSLLNQYIGTWLEVDIWFDLDNDTYRFDVTNTETGNIVKHGYGTHQYNNLGGFTISLEKSDAVTSWENLSPIIDNIVLSSADKANHNAFYLKSFSFSGANGEVEFKTGKDVTKNADVYIAHYSSDGMLLKSIAKQSVAFDSETNTASLTVDNSNASEGDIYKIYIWETGKILPISDSLNKTEKIYLHSIENNIDIHTPLMRDFLEDSNGNCGNYVDGMAAVEEPLPVRFSWASSGNYHYVLKVSESEIMANPWVFETDDCYYDVYNLKIGTRYYWTVDAVDNSEVVYTSNAETFTTLDVAPRNLYIGGTIGNARDIGGWDTTNGKKVKQGLVYRTSALDDYNSNTGGMTEYLTPGGKNIMKNLLGIKTEIDFRVEHEKEESYPPTEKTSSALGNGVAYYHCPILLGADNYLNSVDSLRTIFSILADPNNYPITYHCAVGADRTGMVTYVLNGLLGVSKADLVRDYLITNFSYQQKYRAPVSGAYVATLDGYTGATLQEKIYNYLVTEIGVPSTDLDFIIDYLTE